MRMMQLKMMTMIVRGFMMIRRKLIGKKILISMIIKILRIENKIKFKTKKTLILKQEKEENKKENKES
jgi:hypothetical protein